MQFDENLKKYRNLAGLTQTEVAKSLGISRRAYIAYESGESFPKDPIRLMELSKILDVDIEALFEGVDSDDDREMFYIAGQLAYKMKAGKTSGAARDAVIKYIQQVYWDCKKLSKADKIESNMSIISSFEKEYSEDFQGKTSHKALTKFFIWGTPENHDDFVIVKNEIDRGVLRQGWGREGMDMRRSYDEIEKVWYNNGWPLRECAWRYEKFKKMLDIQEGDIIIIKNVEIENINRVPCCFTLAYCTHKYDFEVESITGDFGHMIGITPIRSVVLAGEDSPMFTEIWRKRGPHGRAFDVLDEHETQDKALIEALKKFL